MNPDNDPFEELLKEQSIRQIPSDWREAILPAKRESRVRSHGWRVLAACWVVILGLQWITPSHTGPQLADSASPSVSVFQQANFQLALAVIQPKGESH